MISVTGTQWNSIISICGVLAAAALSAFVTYKVTARTTTSASIEGNRQREHDSAERSKDRDHQVEMAREALLQLRKSDAYVVIEMYLDYWEQYAQALSIHVTIASRFDDLPPPSIEQQAGALANLMTSPVVMDGMREFQQKISELQVEEQTAKDFKRMVDDGADSARLEFSQSLNRARSLAREAIEMADNLHRQMRAELLTEEPRNE